MNDAQLRPESWKLLSVCIDPAHDNAEARKAYAKLHGADASRWCIATGDEGEIRQLALKCGSTYWDKDGVLFHNLRTILVGKDGKIRHIWTDNNFTASDLLSQLRDLSAKK